jgi:hypothetical protein
MSERRVLIIGGSFAGLCAARALKAHFKVTIVDAKEFFEYTPGILRAYVKPEHLDHLTFTLAPVIEGRMGCKFIWGEVTQLDGPKKTAMIKPKFTNVEEEIDFDYCIIASGCNFGVFHEMGESLWFPTVHDCARPKGSWPHIDERFLEGRRRHILEEHESIKALDAKGSSVMIVGAGFIGVEWVTELQYYFPNLKLTIVDFLPTCLGPLPAKAAAYCSRYLKKKEIQEVYSIKYAPKEQAFWDTCKLPKGVDKEYVCVGVKASSYFMPKDCLSEKGPGGGGWILMNMNLGVKNKAGEAWGVDEQGYPRVFAVGDCNYGCVEPEDKAKCSPPFFSEWPCPPIAKISYPGEEQALIALKNIEKIDKLVYRNMTHTMFGGELKIHDMHWPWGAGMFATSLGPYDACFVAGANWNKGSGWTIIKGRLSAIQKEIIETSKVNECAFGIIGRLIWHFVHHTPIHLWGGGPRFGY